MKSLVQLSCNQLKSNFSHKYYSYMLEARRWVKHLTKLTAFKQSIDDEVGVNFHKIVQSDQFQEFSEGNLSTFLSLDSLNVVEEDEVFNCLMAWVQHNQEARQEYLPKLLELIRISEFSTH